MEKIPETPDTTPEQPSPEAVVIAPETVETQTPKRSRFVLWLAVFVLIVGLIASVALAVHNADKQTATNHPQAADAKPVSAIVKIGSTGFEPATIEVNAGDSVTWTNYDGNPHQVMSDPHPTHVSLEVLNEDLPLQPNESFTVSFEKSGSYTYHDELNPIKFTGKVIVK